MGPRCEMAVQSSDLLAVAGSADLIEGSDGPLTPASGLELLDRALLTLIFSYFDTGDVARARAVCKGWRALLDERGMRREIFRQHWRLSRLLDEPKSPAFYLDAALTTFVHKHTCKPRETLTSIAVKYGVGVEQLKRLNNLMSDFSLCARTHVHVPVRTREQIEGKVGQFILDPIPKRHLVLVLDDSDAPEPAPNAGSATAAVDDIDADRLSCILGRGLKVSKDTARYYLSEAHGNIKAAFQLCEDDMDWEDHFGKLMGG